MQWHSESRWKKEKKCSVYREITGYTWLSLCSDGNGFKEAMEIESEKTNNDDKCAFAFALKNMLTGSNEELLQNKRLSL